MPLAFAPHHWAWVVPFALQPVLYAFRHCTPKNAALCGGGFALVTTMAVSHWIYGAAIHFEGAIYFIIALAASAIVAAPYMAVGYVSAIAWAQRPAAWVFVTATLYTLAEKWVSSGDKGFPFATISLSQIDTTQALLVPMLGSLTLTFITVCIAALLSVARPQRKAFMIATILIACFPCAHYFHGEQLAQEVQRVELVQGKDTRSLLIQTTAPQSYASLIVWPENSMLANGNDQMLADSRLLRKLSASINTTVLAGVSGNDGQFVANRAIATWPDSTQRAYIKQRLVPFAEYVPYRTIFNAFPILRSLTDLRRGAQAVTWTTSDKHLRFVPLICYEAAFPDIVRSIRDADVGIVITDDSWFRDDSGPLQHVDAMRLAAIEYGVPLIVDGSSGPSGVIRSDGQWVQEIPRGASGDAVVLFNARHRDTLFSRLGYYPLVAISLFTLALSGIVFNRVTIEKDEQPVTVV